MAITSTPHVRSASASQLLALTHAAASASPKAMMSRQALRLRPSVMSLSASRATLWNWAPFKRPWCAKTSTKTDSSGELGLRLRDRYFVTLALGHYEARRVQRQVGPGGTSGPIRPWEGEATDEGLELTIDINNRYGALLERRHTRVTLEELRAMNDLAWQLVEHVAVPFARDGALDLSVIEQQQAAVQ